MCVDHGRLHIAMAEELLNGSDVAPVLEQVGGVGGLFNEPRGHASGVLLGGPFTVWGRMVTLSIAPLPSRTVIRQQKHFSAMTGVPQSPHTHIHSGPDQLPPSTLWMARVAKGETQGTSLTTAFASSRAWNCGGGGTVCAKASPSATSLKNNW